MFGNFYWDDDWRLLQILYMFPSPNVVQLAYFNRIGADAFSHP